MHALERRARFGESSRERIDASERESDVGAAGIELQGARELPLGVGVPACLKIGEAQARVAERIVGREVRELLERRLRLGELVSLEVARTQHAREIKRVDGRLLTSARDRGHGGADHEQDV